MSLESFKSTEELLEWISIFLLIIGLILTFVFPSISVLLYIPSFLLLFASKKFRRYIIYPLSLIYVRSTKYTIIPWNPESETRWNANLKRITITTSKSINLKSAKVCQIPVIENGRKVSSSNEFDVSINTNVGKTSYIITPKNPIPIDVNFFVSFEIEGRDNVDEPQPFLEYTIEYKPSWIPFSFWDSRRIR